MAALLLENKIAAEGIRDGIALCMNSVIPALFPFMILSAIVTSMNISFLPKALLPLEKLCGLPKGCGQLFILGLLGGYPTGAQMITQAWEDGKLSTKDASRMLGFCNNAGPAFIFGIGSLFLSKNSVWIVWIIHIFSAILVGMVLPGKSHNALIFHNTKEQTLSNAVERSVKTMAMICSWIILFRMIIKIMTYRFAAYLTQDAYSLISGIMEMTNGIFTLSSFPVLGTRFIFFSTFLSMGGLCVAAQTLSITNRLGAGQYFPGKILQTSISFLLSMLVQHFIYSDTNTLSINLYYIVFAFFIIILICVWLHGKKTVAFLKNMMYNTPRIHT